MPGSGVCRDMHIADPSALSGAQVVGWLVLTDHEGGLDEADLQHG